LDKQSFEIATHHSYDLLLLALF